MKRFIRAVMFMLTAAAATLLAVSAQAGKPKPPPPALTFTPGSYAFGSVTVGASATHTFTLSYSGTGGSGPITATLTPSSGPFTITTNGCDDQSLSASTTCKVTVRYAPQIAGATDNATLAATAGTLTSNQVALSGKGTAPAALIFTPSSWDFDTVAVGARASHTFTLRYSGSGQTSQITITLTPRSGPFTITANNCSGDNLGGQNTCTVTIRYAPRTAGATDVATLTATAGKLTTSVALSGTSPSSNHPPTADDQEVGGYSGSAIPFWLTGSDPDGDPLTFAIASNPSNGTLGAITDVRCGEPMIVAAEPSSCHATVIYFPSGSTTGSDSFTYTVNDGHTNSAAATVSITINPSSVAATPTKLAFGDAQIGPIAMGSKTITFTNTSSSPIHLSDGGIGLPFRIAGSSAFMDLCQDGLAPAGTAGDSCVVNLEFAPPATGSYNDFLVTDWADADGNEVANLWIPLTGTGVVRVDQSPSPVIFDQVAVGTTSAEQTVTFTNKTSTTLYLPEFASPSENLGFAVDASNCLASGIDAGGSCTFSVTFKPTEAGIYHLSLETDWTDGVNTIARLVTPLHGSTTGLHFSVTASPTALDFDEVTVGTTSETKVVTFTNDTTMNLWMTGYSWPGDPFNATMDNDNCRPETGVPPGGTCTIDVTFSPSEATTYSGGQLTTDWAKTGTETVLYNTTTPLTGTGKALPVPPTPSGVSAVSIWTNRIDISWGAVSYTYPVSYLLQRSTTTGGPYETILTTKPGGELPTSFADRTVEPTTTYFYVVKAVNAEGAASAPSQEVSATTGQELSTNGGFESNDFTGWTTGPETGTTIPAPWIDNQSPASGSYTAFLGDIFAADPEGLGSVYISQDVTVPQTGKAYLSFSYLERSTCSSGDFQSVLIENTSGAILATVFNHECAEDTAWHELSSSPSDWAPLPAGTTVRLVFKVSENGDGTPTFMEIDGVSVAYFAL